MTVSAAVKLQEAIFAALTADAGLGFLLEGIYDEAPADARYPYLAMGETSFRNGDLKDTSGAVITFDLIVWSDEASQMQVKELMAAVESTLDAADISVAGHDLVTLRLTSASTVRQWNAAGSLYRGRLGYSALVYSP
jgi:Protein of unknown function (DUF3168)